MKYRTKHFGIKITLVTILVISMWLLAGCSKFEEQLRCSPVDSQECVGWLGDKPVIIKEDL